MTATALQRDIGVYLHVPFCKHACPYCDFYKFELRDRPARLRLDFPGQLAAELRLLLDRDPALARRPLATIYFGGGTPSTLEPGRVARLVETLRASFPPAPGLEVTLEANPENLTPGRARQWAAAGINRLSIGVQSFHEDELALLERLHRPAAIHRAVANARDAGMDNLSLDLMFALPGQDMERWAGNLAAATALAPDHISLYGLTWHEGTPFHRALKKGRLLPAEEDLEVEMFLHAAQFLEECGFEHYEVSNFARPGRRSRHNQRYWLGSDVLPLGPGAHGNLGLHRFANPDDIDAWGASLARGETASTPLPDPGPDIALSERLQTRLRRREGVSRAGEPELYSQCLRWYEKLDGEEERERALLDGEAFRLTRRGWLLLDPIVDAIASVPARRPGED